MTDDKFKIFCGSANPRLAEDICRHLGVKLGEAKLGKFSDGEVYFQILENVRGADVFVVQPCSNPGGFSSDGIADDDRRVQARLGLADHRRDARITATRARTARTSRACRFPRSSSPICWKPPGANRALTLDLHAPQIQGYFNVPVDHLYASPVLIEYFKSKNIGNLTVVSPDAGGVERARAFAKKLDSPLAIVDKRRVDIDVSEVMNLIGDVRGRATLIIDDIIDTAGTLVKTAEALLKEGATKVYAACTHAVLSGPAVERICASQIEEVIVTDSVPLSRSGEKSFKNQGFKRGRVARSRHSFDSRRNFDQRTVFLMDFARTLEIAPLEVGSRNVRFER